MSKPSRRRVRKPLPVPRPEATLDVLALADTLARMDSTGDRLRLSALAGSLPDFAGTLADATMANDDPLAGPDDASDAGDIDDEATTIAQAGGPSVLLSPQLSPGARRGLATIFGAGALAADVYGVASAAGTTPAMVAETAMGYGASTPLRDDMPGLLALARQQRLDAETLAARVMLSLEVIRWLDHVALPVARQPEALIVHLVGALGVERERVCAALSQGEVTAGGDQKDGETDVVGMLTATTSLTATQRQYWLALLSPSH